MTSAHHFHDDIIGKLNDDGQRFSSGSQTIQACSKDDAEHDHAQILGCGGRIDNVCWEEAATDVEQRLDGLRIGMRR